MKNCRRCKELKEPSEFVKNKAFKSGIDTICLVCNRITSKEGRKGKRKQTRKQSSTAYRDVIIDFLIKRDGFNCSFCNGSLEDSKIQINHIIPVALGGQDVMENLNLAHSTCNEQDGLRVRKQSHGY